MKKENPVLCPVCDKAMPLDVTWGTVTSNPRRYRCHTDSHILVRVGKGKILSISLTLIVRNRPLRRRLYMHYHSWGGRKKTLFNLNYFPTPLNLPNGITRFGFHPNYIPKNKKEMFKLLMEMMERKKVLDTFA